MRQIEMREVAERLSELADYYERNAPSERALRVWFDALSGCALDDVKAVLTDWPKSKAKFPVASEVVTSCNDRLSKRIEHEQRQRAQEQAGLVLTPSDPTSPAYLRFKAWFERFRANPPKCRFPDRVGPFVRVGAVVAQARAPTDFETREERRAIQAEGS